MARNVAAELGVGTAEPFRYRNRGAFVNLGRYKAVGRLGRFTFSGFPAWWMARTYHLSQIPGTARKIRAVVVLNMAAGVINLALNIILIPRYGPLGAAIGTSTTLVAHNVFKQFALARTTSIRLLEWRAAKVYLAVAAATLAVWLFEVVFSPPFVVALGAAALASLAVLLASRHALEAAEMFPEVARLPLIRRLVPAAKTA